MDGPMINKGNEEIDSGGANEGVSGGVKWEDLASEEFRGKHFNGEEETENVGHVGEHFGNAESMNWEKGGESVTPEVAEEKGRPIDSENEYQKAYLEAAKRIYERMTPEEQEGEQGRVLRERIESRQALFGDAGSEDGGEVVSDSIIEPEESGDNQEEQTSEEFRGKHFNGEEETENVGHVGEHFGNAESMNWEKGGESVTPEVAEKNEETGVEDESVERLSETAEGREKLNEGFYNELSTLVQVIEKMYPDRAEMPEEARRLSETAMFLQVYLDNGVTGHIHGAELAKDGHAVDKFHSQKYSEAVETYKRLSEQCPEVFEKMKNFETEKVSLDDYKEKIRDAKTAEEVMEIRSNAMKAEGIADMETMYGLRALSSDIDERLHEIDIERHDVRKVGLMEEQKGLENLMRTMEDEYDSAGPIKKAVMNMRGYERNKSDLSGRIVQIERMIASLDDDRNYTAAVRYFERKVQS